MADDKAKGSLPPLPPKALAVPQTGKAAKSTPKDKTAPDKVEKPASLPKAKEEGQDETAPLPAEITHQPGIDKPKVDKPDTAMEQDLPQPFSTPPMATPAVPQKMSEPDPSAFLIKPDTAELFAPTPVAPVIAPSGNKSVVRYNGDMGTNSEPKSNNAMENSLLSAPSPVLPEVLQPTGGPSPIRTN